MFVREVWVKFTWNLGVTKVPRYPLKEQDGVGSTGTRELLDKLWRLDAHTQWSSGKNLITAHYHSKKDKMGTSHVLAATWNTIESWGRVVP